MIAKTELCPPNGVVDADELYRMEIEPSPYLVDGLLPLSLTLISGHAKSYKSFLAMQLGLSITAGKPFLGRKTTRCEVLYYCLEDTLARLHERLHILSDGPAPGLHLLRECKQIGEELEIELDNRLSEYPGVGLIIIDTLQNIRKEHHVSTNLYYAEYAELMRLRKYCDRNHVGIVLVHHHLKSTRWGDDLTRVNGSAAMIGGVDTIWSLSSRNTRDKRTTLHVIGRDVQQQWLSLQCNNGRWSVAEDEKVETTQKADAVVERIIAYVIACQKWSGTSSDLLKEIGVTDVAPSTVGRILKQSGARLEKAGVTYSTSRTKTQRFITLEYICDGEKGASMRNE